MDYTAQRAILQAKLDTARASARALEVQLDQLDFLIAHKAELTPAAVATYEVNAAK